MRNCSDTEPSFFSAFIYTSLFKTTYIPQIPPLTFKCTLTFIPITTVKFLPCNSYILGCNVYCRDEIILKKRFEFQTLKQ